MPASTLDLPSRSGWSASLELQFQTVEHRTVLSRRRHSGPLVVQKPLYPEGPGICQTVLIHPPGGIVGGDRLEIAATLGPHAHALITTPAATKWYRTDDADSRQTVRIEVASGAIVEWLPQETILFDGARAMIDSSVSLAPNAVFAGWEISCFGRRAAGERFSRGALRQSLVIRRENRLLWNERAALSGDDPLLASVVGLAGRHVAGTFVLAAGRIDPALLETSRSVIARFADTLALTALPDLVVARYRGSSAEQARNAFETLRTVLRPWYAGRGAVPPRLWAT